MGLGGWEKRVVADEGLRVTLGDEKSIPILDNDVSCATYKCTKILWIVHFEVLNFMVCEFSLKKLLLKIILYSMVCV